MRKTVLITGRSSGIGRASARRFLDANWDVYASAATHWLRQTDWLWLIIGGFYLLAYLFWYIPVLRRLPRSLGDPPSQFPWHWPLDFTATGLAGSVLLFLGFRRATELTERAEQSETGPQSTSDDVS